MFLSVWIGATISSIPTLTILRWIHWPFSLSTSLPRATDFLVLTTGSLSEALQCTVKISRVPLVKQAGETHCIQLKTRYCRYCISMIALKDSTLLIFNVQSTRVVSGQILWTCTGWNIRRSRPPRVFQLWLKYLVSTRHHWADMPIVRILWPDGERVPWRTQRRRVRSGEGWVPSGCTLPLSHLEMTTNNQIIRDRSPPGSTRTALSAVHQEGG